MAEYETSICFETIAGKEVEIDIKVCGSMHPYRPQTHWEPAEGGFEFEGIEVLAGPSPDAHLNGFFLDVAESEQWLGANSIDMIVDDAARAIEAGDEGDRADRAYDEMRDRHIDGGEFDIGGGA